MKGEPERNTDIAASVALIVQTVVVVMVICFALSASLSHLKLTGGQIQFQQVFNIFRNTRSLQASIQNDRR